MKRVVFSSIVMILGVIFALGGLSEKVNASELPTWPWLNGEPKIVARAPVTEEVPLCTGGEQAIHLTKRDYTNMACVFGNFDEVRMATYTNNQGFAIWAVSFSGDSDFYEVKGLCVGIRRCAYNPKADMLAVQVGTKGLYPSAGFFSHVSSAFVRDIDPITMTVSYRFVPKDEPVVIKKGDSPLPVGALAFSDNGKWAVAELHSYGFIRIDLSNFSMRRITAPGVEYGLGYDPSFELAVSDNGSAVAITGMNAGLDIVQIDNDCGDTVNETMPTYFSNAVDRCMFSPLDRTKLFPTFRGGVHPRFAHDGNTLTVSVFQKTVPFERVVFVPIDADPAEHLPLLALGDSFSSGEGETDDTFYKPGTNTGVHLCHTSQRSYAFLLAKAWNVQAESVACSGAVVNDVSGSSAYTGEGGRNKSLSDAVRMALEKQSLEKFQPGNRRQSDFVQRYLPQVITVGAGGNDAGLMDKLRVCLGADQCEWASDASKRQATAEEIKASYDKIRTMLRQLRTISPESYVIAVGYPLVINDSDSGACGPLLGRLLDPVERRFMNESVTYLNSIFKAAALSEGILFINTEDALTGRRLCDKTPDAMNGLRLGGEMAPLAALPLLKIIGAESFHPTPIGHSLVVQSILQAMPVAPGRANCSDCASEHPAPEPMAYRQAGSAERISQKQVHADIVAERAYKEGETAPLTTQPYQFAPHTTVKIELHSDPIQLGSFTSDEEGKVPGSITIPALSEGYHTLHIYGTSWSGDPIDVYQVIPVQLNDTLAVFDGEVPPASLSQSSPPSVPQSVALMNTGVPPEPFLQRTQAQPVATPLLPLAPSAPGPTKKVPLHASSFLPSHPSKKQAVGLAPIVGILGLAVAAIAGISVFIWRQKAQYQV